MPFIHVRSLPFEEPLDAARTVEGISRDFSQDVGVGLEHVTATWTFLEPGHYAAAGQAAERQPRSSHPVLVDLFAPDFNSTETVETMLSSVAASISTRTGVPVENVFIAYRPAHSAMVFDAGEIVRW